MKQFGKEDSIMSYREWLKDVNSVKIEKYAMPIMHIKG